MNLIEKYNLKKSDWVKKSAQAYLHLCYPWIYAAILPPTSIKDPMHQPCVCVIEDGILTVFWNATVMKGARDRMFDELQKNSNYLEELKKQYYEKVDIYLTILNKINLIDLSNVSDDELSNLYSEFFNAYINEFKYFLVLGEAISHQSIDFVEPIFRNKLGEDFDKVFPILTHPSKPSFIEEERTDRNKIIAAYLLNESFDEGAIKEHIEKYYYINSNYANGEKLTNTQLKDLILKDIEQGEKGTVKNQLDYDKASFIEKYKLDDNDQFLLKIVDEFFKLVDDRKKYMMMASYYQIEFLKQLATRTNIDFDLLTFSIYPEFKDILFNSFDVERLRQRSNGTAILLDGDSPVIYIDDDYIQIRNSFIEKANSEIITQIIGKVASKGKVQGIVKVVLRAEDISKVEQGDILVASMTRPEMVPAMKLAAAFVTNEGGITCHAAIVAREMSKPCVISTKIATDVLKDGDVVEVDANSGVIRIIK